MELDADRSISLEMTRRWPKYVVAWAVRQQIGESDFPVASGEVERLPGSQPDIEEIWTELRQEALDQASGAVESAPVEREQPSAFRSFLNRLTGRS